MDTLTIQCCSHPDDKVELDPCNLIGKVFISTVDINDHGTPVILNRESATKLRDALTDWLEGQV